MSALPISNTQLGNLMHRDIDHLTNEEISLIPALQRGYNNFTVPQKRILLGEIQYYYQLNAYRVPQMDHEARYLMSWDIADAINDNRNNVGIPYKVSGLTVFLLIGTFFNENFVLEDYDAE
ncbi:hypothetical protein QAD02_021080 [Eretmocerus hayati]|uniref:Uncharacterized protein n=1 Tax=Eretmocerus hayati TaxID=131215 RepID=A0ACC2PSF1_9HYME|nr:hypothetical protein QAD02_021080 [Eretmocerus hayati]